MIPILCESQKEKKIIETKTLIDCRAGGTFIHPSFIKKHSLNPEPLAHPITPRNINGTINKDGDITHYVRTYILMEGQKIRTNLYITSLGKHDIILGLPWLTKHKAIADWGKGTLELPKNPNKVTMEEAPNEEEWKNTSYPSAELEQDLILAFIGKTEAILINQSTVSQILAHQEQKEPDNRTLEEMIL